MGTVVRVSAALIAHFDGGSATTTGGARMSGACLDGRRCQATPSRGVHHVWFPGMAFVTTTRGSTTRPCSVALGAFPARGNASAAASGWDREGAQRTSWT
jgi:hypothetical protein